MLGDAGRKHYGTSKAATRRRKRKKIARQDVTIRRKRV